ncbi:cytidine deaminase family protein [Streptomyces sp. NBC_00989]|uniref:cytidine deaminase family protein n=1 Tax=Streptomyces sp. NBC_00989 TaxID=2903705 RepID=UPI003862EA33
MIELTQEQRRSLSLASWEARSHARVHGPTQVGCAALADDGRIFQGCNVEHRFRSHDIHAETNAISSLVAGGARRLVAVLISAERERFTPCGSCMDWIFEIGGDDCFVISERHPGEVNHELRASDLMPFYPH